MSFAAILAIALGLAMDAFSVAVGVGAARRTPGFLPLFRLAAAFGFFQFFMPIAGWMGGSTVAPFIGAYDHWVAFGLLALVGGKMIYDGVGGEEEHRSLDPTRGWTLLMLSVATSIDALAVGLSLALLGV
ncbi:MAG: manganese efflux pump MntP family protein, partial [Syntrophales bacterium]|nr:manganese efflux pump MntP family protein [Syntrophales bacterium]